MGMGRVRYLPFVLLAVDAFAALTTLAVAMADNTPAAARDVYAILIAEFLAGVLLLAAAVILGRIWPTDSARGGPAGPPPVPVLPAPQPPALDGPYRATLTRQALPAYATTPEPVRWQP